MQATCVQVMFSPQKGIRFLGAGISGGCEPLDLGAGN